MNAQLVIILLCVTSIVYISGATTLQLLSSYNSNTGNDTNANSNRITTSVKSTISHANIKPTISTMSIAYYSCNHNYNYDYLLFVVIIILLLIIIFKSQHHRQQ